MPQTAYYAHQAQTTLPPPAPTKIISSHFAHLSNIRTLANAKGYIESARISSHHQLWGENKKNAKLSHHYQLKGLSMFSAGFTHPLTKKLSQDFLRHIIKKHNSQLSISSSDSFNFNLLHGQEKWIFWKMTKTRKLTFRLSPRHSLATTTSAAGQVHNRHLMAHSKLIAGE